jgi:hypothetical protein
MVTQCMISIRENLHSGGQCHTMKQKQIYKRNYSKCYDIE